MNRVLVGGTRSGDIVNVDKRFKLNEIYKVAIPNYQTETWQGCFKFSFADDDIENYMVDDFILIHDRCRYTFFLLVHTVRADHPFRVIGNIPYMLREGIDLGLDKSLYKIEKY